MADRTQLRAWLLALDRFELRLRLRAARARNAFLRESADGYLANGQVPGWLHERHRRRLEGELIGHYEMVIPYFGAQSLKQIKSRRIEKKQSESIFAALIREWISREALRKARLIAATDAEDVRNAIQEGVGEGEGVDPIARRIRRLTGATPVRAATIARTETHAAATFGSIESVRRAEEELGLVMLKKWLPTLDSRTREDHAAMTKHPATPLGEKFTVGGSLMDRPGDPSAPAEQVINCRCALAYEEATE